MAARFRAPVVRAGRPYGGRPLAWIGRAPVGAQGGPGSRAQSGQGLVEYGVIIMIMAVACVISLVFFGDQLSSLFSLIASAV